MINKRALAVSSTLSSGAKSRRALKNKRTTRSLIQQAQSALCVAKTAITRQKAERTLSFGELPHLLAAIQTSQKQHFQQFSLSFDWCLYCYEICKAISAFYSRLTINTILKLNISLHNFAFDFIQTFFLVTLTRINFYLYKSITLNVKYLNAVPN
jgi:hypothetical protein